MTNKKKQRTRALAKKANMAYSAASNVLNATAATPEPESEPKERRPSSGWGPFEFGRVSLRKEALKWVTSELPDVRLLIEEGGGQKSWREAVACNAGYNFERMLSLYNAPPPEHPLKEESGSGPCDMVGLIAGTYHNYNGMDEATWYVEVELAKSFEFFLGLYLAEQGSQPSVDWGIFKHTMKCSVRGVPLCIPKLFLEKGAPVEYFPLLDAEPEIFSLLAQHGAARPSEADVALGFKENWRIPARGLIDHYGFTTSSLYPLIRKAGRRGETSFPKERDIMGRVSAFKALDYFLELEGPAHFDLAWLDEDVQMHAFHTIYDTLDAGPHLRTYVLKRATPFAVVRVLDYIAGSRRYSRDTLQEMWDCLGTKDREELGVPSLEHLILRSYKRDHSKDFEGLFEMYMEGDPIDPVLDFLAAKHPA